MDRLGRMGEVVDVAGGYARNYLIPQGLAVGVTRGRMKEIEEQKRVLEVKAARQREDLESVADKVRSKPIKVKSRCSATGKLFGSVTNRQLAQAILELTGDEIDRHKIVMDGRIRAVGTYSAVIKLHPDVLLELEFEVEGEGFVPEEPPPEDEEGETGAPEAQPLEGGLSARPDEVVDTDPDSEDIQPLEGGLSDRPGDAPESRDSTEAGNLEGGPSGRPDEGVDTDSNSEQE